MPTLIKTAWSEQSYWAQSALPKVPILDVVVETDAVGAAELGQDFHDFVLLLWREHVFAVMDSVVGAITATKERANATTGLGSFALGYVVI